MGRFWVVTDQRLKRNYEFMNNSDWDEILPGVLVHNTAVVDVKQFAAGKGTVVNAHAVIRGTKVQLGRECWIDEYAVIGGGSCFDPMAYLEAGDWLHMGQFSQLNTARGVVLGDEVGIGIGTRVFTHGSYLSEWDGFPVDFRGVTIGNRVWIPNALVNPGVNIGNNVVIASGSVVSNDIADGSLVGGVPAKLIRRDSFPKQRSLVERRLLMDKLREEMELVLGIIPKTNDDYSVLKYGDAVFNLVNRSVVGKASSSTELIRNQLRRHGIRFPVDVASGEYKAWE